VSLRIPSSSRSPDHDPHHTNYYLGYPLGRFAGLKHRQLARREGVIITGRIRRTLVKKINLLVDNRRFNLQTASCSCPDGINSMFQSLQQRIHREYKSKRSQQYDRLFQPCQENSVLRLWMCCGNLVCQNRTCVYTKAISVLSSVRIRASLRGSRSRRVRDYHKSGGDSIPNPSLHQCTTCCCL
jgi:hypothetical protein